MNMIDYLGWRGDITFAEKGINDVDNLIFSELAYMDLRRYFGGNEDRSLTIAQVYDFYSRDKIDQSGMMNDPLPLLRKAALTERFMNVRVRWYSDETDTDLRSQFAAVTFIYRESEAYVAFRGTDNSIVGWHECFNMSFINEIPGQTKAVAYLNRAAGLFDGSLYVGGHSKGGNLAVYASAFCENEVKDRIVRIYSNDGPGFLSAVSESEEYISVLSKIRKIVPESSLVGNLLYDKVNNFYIRSSAKGFAQHDPYTWCVHGIRFEDADRRADSSIFMSDTTRQWLSSLSDENKRLFVDTVFGSLEDAGIKMLNEFSEVRLSTYRALLKAVTKIDKDKMTDLQKMLIKLVKSGRNVALAGGKN